MSAHDLDELASAVVDGLLPPEEAAAALGDPAVARRVAEMRAAQQLVRSTPPVDPARRESALAAALDAFPPAGATSPAGARPTAGGPSTAGPGGSGHRPPPPVPLAGRRRRPWADPRWLTAAAVLLVVLAFGGLVATQGTSSNDDETADAGGDEDTSVAAPQDSAEESAESGGSGEADDGAAEQAPSAEAAPDAAPDAGPEESDTLSGSDAEAAAPVGPAIDLGSVGSEEALVARVEEALRDPSGTRAVAPPAVAGSGATLALDRCGAPAEAGTTRLVATATLAGEPVALWVTDDGGGPRLVAVDDDCAPVVDRPVTG